MTYCVAVQLNAGLVFASDSRTNAGIDQISTYQKMHCFEWPGDRALVVLSTGNLATTQAVIKRLQEESKEGTVVETNLRTVPTMERAAALLGQVNTDIKRSYASNTPAQASAMDATFIIGGQIKGGEPELYMVYPEGNYIQSSNDQPFLQAGEFKYGKPILDRIIESTLSLEDAARCMIVSLDSTIQSNLSVGPPIDLSFYKTDAFSVEHHLRFKQNSPFYTSLRKRWREGLREVFIDLPRFDWEKDEPDEDQA
jgi:putative proteasome-type protease